VQVHDVDQGSPEWFALRAGRPTASDFKRLITATGKPSTQLSDYAATLAAELYAGRPLEVWEGNQWTERGKELEPMAADHYRFVHEVELERVGFVTNHEIGCSPDYLVGKDGMLEIKCLAPWKHVQALAYWNKHKRPPPDYVAQAQGQLLICLRDWLDLLLFHPELPPVTIRVRPDFDYQRKLCEQIEICLVERNDLVELLRAA
jgi:hypothetical protein